MARSRQAGIDKGMGGVAAWLPGIVAGLGVAVSPASILLLAAFLMPVVPIALFLDGTPGRRVGRAALLFGLATCFEPLWRLWQDGGGVGTALDELARPTTLFTAWLATAAGWLVAEASLAALRLLHDARRNRELGRIDDRLVDLEREWGPLPKP
jgi:hypothetical protein